MSEKGLYCHYADFSDNDVHLSENDVDLSDLLNRQVDGSVATTIEITTTIEIFISIVVENKFQT